MFRIAASNSDPYTRTGYIRRKTTYTKPWRTAHNDELCLRENAEELVRCGARTDAEDEAKDRCQENSHQFTCMMYDAKGVEPVSGTALKPETGTLLGVA